MKQYTCCFKKWWEFNVNLKFDPYEYKLEKLIQFFNQETKKGASFTSINSYASALKLVFEINQTDEKHIKRYLKGCFNLKPPKPRYTSTWDPFPVLELLSKWYPLAELDIRKLTLKLVTLMALVTGHRIQTFSKIRVANIHWYEDRAEVVITDKIKTTNYKSETPVLVLPVFEEKPELCIASTLREYVSRTEHLREPSLLQTTFLIITLKKPIHPATPQTISRWIKLVLTEAGIDTKNFSSYSTRHASTSAASRAGVNIREIRRAAGWTEQSNTFLKFYNRPVLGDNTQYAKGVLRGSNILL